MNFPKEGIWFDKKNLEWRWLNITPRKSVLRPFYEIQMRCDEENEGLFFARFRNEEHFENFMRKILK